MSPQAEGRPINPPPPRSAGGIAIIGMAGRFPGAPDLRRFWQNLRDGVESISRFSDEELAASIPRRLLSDPSYVKARGVLEDAALFDAPFFGFNPREAALTDPQHRLLLECAWEALESAGSDPAAFGGRIGVYVGAGSKSYLLANVAPSLVRPGMIEDLDVQLGTYSDFLASRISYKLDLRGPSVNVQAACATSLVAVHLACASLRANECDMALAGGVTVLVPEKGGYLFAAGGVESPDGHCRAFDARARGTVFGSGAGIVLLKRLDDALRDGDPIRAVIKGSAINNDGSAKVGYAAPSIEGQRRVIEEALADAGVDAETIGYVEAHGTGTELGDPIEVAALARAFRATTAKTGFCAIGSVKTNIGHTVAAAGVAGLLKTVLALQHRQLPPSLHFDTPNSTIDFASTPFYVNAALAPWAARSGPRRAGVSSFGMGGTNAHVILEEAPETPVSTAAPYPCQLLTLSARTELALDAATRALAVSLTERPQLDLADAAYTLQTGRRAFRHRRVVMARDATEVVRILDAADPAGVFTGVAEAAERPVAFLFPGQGTQHPGMARELYRIEPSFRAHVDRCCAHLEPILGTDLRQVLYPPEDGVASNESPLDQTRFTQPALFVIEHALASLLMTWGVRPRAMLGHSVGEYVAACLAGVFSLEEALMLVAARGRLVQEVPRGSMLAVLWAADALAPLVRLPLALAAVNAPSLCVVSGPTPAIEDLEHTLAERRVPASRLRTSHAFHSPMMDPVLSQFRRVVESVQLRPPAIPFVSNVTGTWITAEASTDPDYWVRHLRQTVRFADGLRTLAQDPPCTFLEVGPGHTLTKLAQQQAAKAAGPDVLSVLPHSRESRSDAATLLEAAGRLWVTGVPVDWRAVHNGARRRVLLPTYPFERQRHWLEPPGPVAVERGAPPVLEKRDDPASWLYVPTWKRSPGRSPGPADRRLAWLLLVGPGRLGATLADRLAERGETVVRVEPGDRFSRLGAGRYTVRPRQSHDYSAVLDDLARRGQPMTVAVHAWALGPGTTAGTDAVCDPDQEVSLGYYSLIALAQALGRRQDSGSVRIAVLATGLHDVTGDETLCPMRAALLGPCRVIPQEYLALSCRAIDVVLPEPGSPRESVLFDQLVAELASDASEPVVAYRGPHRWVQGFEPLPPAAPGTPTLLRERGIYLVTGGFGRVGEVLAQHLARSVRARLVLVGRTTLPPRAAWPEWLKSHQDADPISCRIRLVEQLEALGSDVEVVSADVADAARLSDAVGRAEARFGRIDGLIHAAGLVEKSDFHAIDDLKPSAAEPHFRAKVEGLVALDRLVGERTLDFCLLTSSLSAVLGGPGFAAYAAANAFMDAFAQARRRSSSVPWIAIDWDAWQTLDPPGRGTLLDELALTPDEAVATFDVALSRPAITQLVISTADLTERSERARSLAPRRTPVLRTASTLPAASVASEKTGSATSPEREGTPRTKMEDIIASVWQELLDVPQVGVRDNFFDLGGHSLLAVKVIGRLEKAIGIRVDLQELMFQSLGQLAAAVEARMPARWSGRAGGTGRLRSAVRSFVQSRDPKGNGPG